MTVHSGKDVREEELLFTIGGSATFIATMEIDVTVPQEAENRYTSRSNYITLGIKPKEINILLHRYFFIHVYCCYS